MSLSRAVGFLMPAGTQFLFAGSSSSFPRRFHSPSNSKVVSTCLRVPSRVASGSLHSSLNSIFSASESESSSVLSSPFRWQASRSVCVRPEKRGYVCKSMRGQGNVQSNKYYCVHPSLPIPKEYFWNSGVRWEMLVMQQRYLSRTYQHISQQNGQRNFAGT